MAMSGQEWAAIGNFDDRRRLRKKANTFGVILLILTLAMLALGTFATATIIHKINAYHRKSATLPLRSKPQRLE